MPQALLVKLGAIGDVIMAVPAAHALHRQGYRIDWIAGPAVLPLLRLYPWIHPIAVDERALLRGSIPVRAATMLALWRQLGLGASYDLVATLYYDPRYRMLTLPVRARRRVMLSHSDRSHRLLPGRHHTDEYARLLLDLPDQVRPVPLTPVPPPLVPPSPLPRGERVQIVLAPAGAKNLLADDALRRWPAESYVLLATALLAQGCDVVLIGGPDDAWVQPLFRALPVTDLIGKLELPDTLGLLDKADVLVTHDTGPLHLGGLARCGIVGLFGPTDPRGRLPQRPRTVALWGGEGFACRPCYDGRTFAPCPSNECLRQLGVDRVLGEVRALLKAQEAGLQPSPRVASPWEPVDCPAGPRLEPRLELHIEPKE